jgi:outer membrane protein OmpA-like peptidoglycan-associated protein
MRFLSLLALLVAASLTFAQPASAQVTTDEHALDALKAPAGPAPKPEAHEPRSEASKPKPERHEPAPAHARPHRRPERAHAAPVAPPASAAKRLGPPPTVPPAPPPNAVLAPPPFVMPSHAPPPPPPVPVRADAPGTATPINSGTQITFGKDGSDLNPATLAALHTIADAALANPAMIVSITAWAPGTPDDPSTPRRLSLDRALAARAVLINAGIVSSRIRAVAKGTTDIGKDPPDRADVVEILPGSQTH